MKKIRKGIVLLSVILFVFIFAPNHAFAITAEEIANEIAPNNTILFNSVRPADRNQAEFMVISDFIIDYEGKYENFRIWFNYVEIDINNEVYDLDNGILEIYEGNDLVKRIDVKVKYKEGDKIILNSLAESIKVFDKINIKDNNYLKTGYRINDLALVNYYYYNIKEDVDDSWRVGNIVKFSPEFIRDTKGSNFSYLVDCRAGDGSSLDLWNACFGGMTAYYDGMAYGYHDIGEIEEHVIYIDNSVEDTPDATVKAVEQRIKDYLNIDVEVKYEGTISQLKQKVYDDGIAYYNEQTSIGFRPGDPNGTAEEYAQGLVDNLFNDDIRKESEFDGRYYMMELNGYKFYFLVVRTNTKEIQVPTYLGKDIYTDIQIKTDSSTVPLDTALTVKDVTASISKDTIGTENYKSYDISLYSDAKGSKIEKIKDGTFLVKIPVPTELNGKELIVYYITSSGEKEEHIVTVKDGYAEFETNHFSIYTLAEKVSSSAGKEPSTPTENNPSGGNITEDPVSGNTNTSTNNPQTSDNSVIYMSILAVSLTGLISGSIYLAKKKVMKKN